MAKIITRNSGPCLRLDFGAGGCHSCSKYTEHFTQLKSNMVQVIISLYMFCTIQDSDHNS